MLVSTYPTSGMIPTTDVRVKINASKTLPAAIKFLWEHSKSPTIQFEQRHSRIKESMTTTVLQGTNSKLQDLYNLFTTYFAEQRLKEQKKFTVTNQNVFIYLQNQQVGGLTKL